MGENFTLIFLIITTLCGFLLFFVFNVNILKLLHKFVAWVMTYIAGQSYDIESKLSRLTALRGKSLSARYYRWCNNLLVTLGYRSKGITVTGYTIYNLFIALLLVIVASALLQLNVLLIILAYVLIVFVLGIVSELRAAAYLERREAAILNAMDMIVPQIDAGVKNAIILVLPSIDPLIQNEFRAFLENINGQSLTFADSMLYLRYSLGNCFDDFAQKAILYELSEDIGMIDIFSDIIEVNHIKRQLRYESNVIFSELRAQMLISLAIIAGFSILFAMSDAFVRSFFLDSTLGKFTLLLDITLLIGVLGYITKMKGHEF